MLPVCSEYNSKMCDFIVLCLILSTGSVECVVLSDVIVVSVSVMVYLACFAC